MRVNDLDRKLLKKTQQAGRVAPIDSQTAMLRQAKPSDGLESSLANMIVDGANSGIGESTNGDTRLYSSVIQRRRQPNRWVDRPSQLVVRNEV